MDLKKNLDYYSDYFEALFFGESELENTELDFLDINEECLKNHIKDLDNFFNKADSILEETDYTHAQACHDFYFTRCGHGVGFWEADHCSEEQGEKLTEIAKSFGEFYAYIGDDNKIYLG